MSYMSEKDEDTVFNSLSPSQKRQYFENLRGNGVNVNRALDSVVGPVWFDRDGDPKGGLHRHDDKR
ncbi:MAG: hypothetical protein NTW79_01895 [Candidatus Berkelbacteria bacterium]|nr:hypothetical protein [Candidatus Berkelbacteria bacterium]